MAFTEAEIFNHIGTIETQKDTYKKNYVKLYAYVLCGEKYNYTPNVLQECPPMQHTKPNSGSVTDAAHKT